MKSRCVIIAVAATAVGVAAGWFAGGLGESSFAKASAAEQALADKPEDRREGRASVAARPKRKAPIRSTADAEVKKRALEKRIQFLEQSIRAEKERRAERAKGEKSTSNAELVEKLMKLPTEAERSKALNELGEERLKTFTLAELAKLCPKMFAPPDGDDGKKIKDKITRTHETVSERLAILDTVDQSGMSEEERKLHADYIDNLVRMPGLFDKMVDFDSYDSVTWGEQCETIQSLVSSVKRHRELAAAEMKMLFSQAAKSLDIPGGKETELISTLDEVAELTNLSVQEVWVAPLLWY